ncbi:hypothetical protein MIZ03_3340 [Rhodoferax lithotrophicus]|uniref:Uncharacterized protein n=1 Tax=Rhodoferax lithotrophicus TaxID=2798804 RepID=A0ABM7MQ24_9BURK|nr:hypothetical protein MIZ03_3340 [Rhodoferax sp. MIZ03]
MDASFFIAAYACYISATGRFFINIGHIETQAQGFSPAMSWRRLLWRDWCWMCTHRSGLHQNPMPAVPIWVSGSDGLSTPLVSDG